MTPFEARLTNMLEPSLLGLGYDLVRVMLRGDVRKTLQVMAERRDQRGMTTEDCETISETVSALLDVHDPIKERYALEISSPGIDRPLVKPQDYTRYLGHEAKIDLKEMIDGRRHLRGILIAADEQKATIKLEGNITFEAPYHAVNRAQLVLTDELIDAHLEFQKQFETINQEPVSVEADLSQEK